jgi:hypothetical protein
VKSEIYIWKIWIFLIWSAFHPTAEATTCILNTFLLYVCWLRARWYQFSTMYVYYRLNISILSQFSTMCVLSTDQKCYMVWKRKHSPSLMPPGETEMLKKRGFNDSTHSLIAESIVQKFKLLQYFLFILLSYIFYRCLVLFSMIEKKKDY